MTRLFGQLPDESLFGSLKIFLGETDELFFNRSLISSEMAVSLPHCFGSRAAGSVCNVTGRFRQR